MPRFSKQMVWANLYDAQGNNTTGLVNGVLQDGPLTGIDITSYNMVGTRLDKIGNLGFRVPLDVRRSLGLGPGSQIKFFESFIIDPATGLPSPVAHGAVESRSEKVSADGMWAEFQCPDVMQELVYANIGGGCAFGLQDTITADLAAIVGRQTETPWVVTNGITGYDGMSFTANLTSSYEAVTKLIAMTGGHITRGSQNGGRELVVSNFGGETGLLFQRPSKIAGRRNPYTRFISDLEVDYGGTIVNDLTPTGAGNGITALTLAELAPVDANGVPQPNPSFINGTIPGYNPYYPIKARKRMDNGGLDGYDYYLDDPNSVIAYRRQAKGLARTDIGPISAATTDKVFAAAALYIATRTTLAKNAYPLTTIKVSTYAYPGLDNRFLAGNKVLVQYQKTNANGDLIINLNDFYYVVDCNRRVTDGRLYDEWTLSSNAEWENNSLTAIVVGSTQAIDTIRVAPQIYPSESNIWFAEDIAPGGDIVIHIPGSKSYVRTLSGLFNFYPQQLRGTVDKTDNGAHAHATNVLAQQVPEPSHNTVLDNHTHGFAGKTTGAWNGQGPPNDAWYSPNASLTISAKGTIAGFALYEPSDHSTGGLLAEGGYNKNMPVSASLISWSTMYHTHDMNGITTDNNSGGVSLSQNVKTVPPTALTTAQQGFGDRTTNQGSYFGNPTIGGDHTHDQVYTLILVGSPPTGISILVDTIAVVTNSNNPADLLGLDLGKYFNDQADHTLTIKSATMGRIQGTGTIRRHVTTVATS